MGQRFIQAMSLTKKVRPGGMITSSYELNQLESNHQVTSDGDINAQAKIIWQEINTD